MPSCLDNADPSHRLVNLLSNDSTIALGQSSSSMEFEDYQLNSKVDLITTTFGSKPPTLPLREERQSLGVETVYKAKGVGWQGVRKKCKAEKERKQRSRLQFDCSYVISWGACGGSEYDTLDNFDDDDSFITYSNGPHSSQKFATAHTADMDGLKALTYEEYLEYLRKCQEKLKVRKNDAHEYLELETHPDLQESSYRRKRIFTSYFEDNRDDRFGICCAPSNQEMRDMPSTVHSFPTASILSTETNDVPPIEPLPLVKQRKVSFSDIQHVKTIPARQGQDKVETGDSKKLDEKDVIKTELISDLDVILGKIQSSRQHNVDAKTKGEGDVMTSPFFVKATNDIISSLESQGQLNAARSRTNNNTPTKSPLTKLVEESSPTSRVQRSRNRSLLDRMHLKDESSPSPSKMSTNKRSLNTIVTDTAATSTKTQSLRSSGKEPTKNLSSHLVSDTNRNNNRIFLPSRSPGKDSSLSRDNDRKMSPIPNVSDIKTNNDRNVQSSFGTRKEPSKPRVTNERKISPMKASAAADLARLLLADIETISKSIDKSYTPKVNQRPTSKPLTSFFDYCKSNQSKSNQGKVDYLKVDPLLCKEREKHKISSIDLARKMLEEVQNSLDEEEKVVTNLLAYDSYESCPNASLYTSSLKGDIKPCYQEKTNNSDAHVDNIKLDPGLYENRIKRKVESIDMAKSILNEIRSTLDEEEMAISSPVSIRNSVIAQSRSIMTADDSKVGSSVEKGKDTKTQNVNETEFGSSSSSFDIPSTNVFLKQQLEDDTSSFTKSSFTRYPTNTNHPAELAKRRAQDTRDRHRDIDDISRSSQESEDSWSQPHNIPCNDVQSNWDDESESVSLSSIEKIASASTSAELARRLIKEATIRHKNIAQCQKPNRQTKEECIDEDSATKNSLVSSEQRSLNVRIINPQDDEHKQKSITSSEEGTSLSSNIISSTENNNKQIEEESILVPTNYHEESNDDVGDKVIGQNNNESNTLGPQLQSSNSIGKSEELEESEMSSSFTDDSLNNVNEKDNQNVKESTDLAKQLLENAKKALQKVQISKILRNDDTNLTPKPTQKSNTTKKVQPPEELLTTLTAKSPPHEENMYGDSSAELAKRLLREAFTQPHCSSPSSNSTKSIASLEECNDDNDEGKQQSVHVTRKIMDEIGFGDLFSGEAKEEGSFDKMIRIKEDNVIEEEDYDKSFALFGRSMLDSIKEEDDIYGNMMDQSQSSHSSNKIKTSRSSSKNSPLKSSELKTIVDARNDEETLEKETTSADTQMLTNSISSTNNNIIRHEDATPRKQNLSSIYPKDNYNLHNKQDTPLTKDKATTTKTTTRTTTTTSSQVNVSPQQQTQVVKKNKYNQESQFKVSNIIQYQIPKSDSMTSYDSSSSSSSSSTSSSYGGFSIKSTKLSSSSGGKSQSFEIKVEDPISFTINELKRINSRLEMTHSSCHSSYASGETGTTRDDVLYYAKQSKEEIAALAKAIENQVNAEDNLSFDYDNDDNDDDLLSYDDDEDEEQGDNIDNSVVIDDGISSTGTGSSSYIRMKRRVTRNNTRYSRSSPTMDRLIEDVNELCNQIESRIDNIVNDTLT